MGLFMSSKIQIDYPLKIAATAHFSLAKFLKDIHVVSFSILWLAWPRWQSCFFWRWSPWRSVPAVPLLPPNWGRKSPPTVPAVLRCRSESYQTKRGRHEKEKSVINLIKTYRSLVWSLGLFIPHISKLFTCICILIYYKHN